MKKKEETKAEYGGSLVIEGLKEKLKGDRVARFWFRFNERDKERVRVGIKLPVTKVDDLRV